jgi:hypothetical protein
MEALTPDPEPFGVRTMLVEPGFFRTDLVTEQSTKYPTPSITDYAEKTRQTVTAWKGMGGQQPGDPAKIAQALVHLASEAEPPLRWPGGRGRCGRRRAESEAFACSSGRPPSVIDITRLRRPEKSTRLTPYSAPNGRLRPHRSGSHIVLCIAMPPAPPQGESLQ